MAEAKKLYRILFRNIVNEDIDILKDKIWKADIPSCRLEGENSSIKRLCFSDSIENCLSGYGEERIENLFLENKQEPIPILILEINIENLKKEDYLTPAEIYGNRYVIDAIENQEYWILKDIRADNIYKGFLKEIILDEDIYTYPVPYHISAKYNSYEEASDSEEMEDYICNPSPIDLASQYFYKKIVGTELFIE